MSTAQHLAAANAAFATVLAGIRPDQLDSPTPCAEFDVRALGAHVLRYGPALEGAATKGATDPAQPGDGPWADEVRAQVERCTRAWADPAAWEGVTTMGGPDPLPAPLIGNMVLCEYVVHAWDLARATGQEVELDADLVAAVHAELVRTAPMGRERGAFGPEAPVPHDAPLLDRLLGLAGRDPRWAA